MDILIAVAVSIVCTGGVMAFFLKKVSEPTAQTEDRSEEIMKLRIEIAKLEQQIEDLEKNKLDDLERWKEQAAKHKQDLEAVAREVLEESAKKSKQEINEIHANGLTKLLEPVKLQFNEFKEKVDKYYTEDVKWRGVLDHELKQLTAANLGLNEQAENLARALKGDSKIQGDWGEYQLEQILENVGLTKGIHFSTQENEKDELGGNKRPDFIVKLPDGKVLVIDSKVSLTAYERMVNAEDDAEREIQLKAHVQSLRNHIRGLSKKDYSSLYSHSVDYTLMFVPVEPALIAAGAEIQSIQQEGLKAQVLLVSTSTIIATLRTISYIWRQEQQRANVVKIAERGERLYSKFVGFTKSMESIGKHLQSADNAYTDAMKKLSEGNGNLISQAEKLRKLGLNVKETVSEKLIDASEDTNDDEA